MDNKFDDIRPYNDEEALLALPKLYADPKFQGALSLLAGKYPLAQVKEEFAQFHSIYEFQRVIVKRFLDFFFAKSISKVTYAGLENLKKDQPYLFIANHRDIVLDTAFLQNYFFENDFNSTKIAFGDNLLSSPTLSMFAMLNKLFMVKRGGSLRERLANSQQLSEYIHHVILEEKESVWIAQRNGRTKNGIDQTQQGLIKMIGSCAKPQFMEGLMKMNIVPVTVSYEYESCDQLKARELALSEGQAYVKKPGEDMASIKQGIGGYKGQVHFVIGKPITEQIAQIDPALSNNEKAVKICHLIDQQIYANYQLYPNNFIAYDMMEGTQEFTDRYTAQQKEEFVGYLKKQSVVEDVAPEKMMHYLLAIYGNPVKTHFNKNIQISSEDKYL